MGLPQASDLFRLNAGGTQGTAETGTHYSVLWSEMLQAISDNFSIPDLVNTAALTAALAPYALGATVTAIDTRVGAAEASITGLEASAPNWDAAFGWGNHASAGYLIAVPAATDAVLIADGSVSNSEFQYLANVTSDIQSQIDSKSANGHTHDATEIVSGVIDIARIPAAVYQAPIVSSGAIADLDAGQQSNIIEGTHVVTTDGRAWVYSGSGDKILEASYVEIADKTPEWSVIANKPTEFTPTAHTHIIGDVTGLQAALDGKQAAGSYAAAVHTHTIANVTGLQTALDGKAANTNVANWDAAFGWGNHAVAGYAAGSHTHTIANITGLQTALDSKLEDDGVAFTIGNYTFDTDQTVGAGEDDYVLTYDNASGQIRLEVAAGGGGGADVTADETVSGDWDFIRDTAGLLRYTFQNLNTSAEQQTDIHIATVGTAAADLYLGVNYTNAANTFLDSRPRAGGVHSFRFEGTEIFNYNASRVQFIQDLEVRAPTDAGVVQVWALGDGSRPLSLTSPLAANGNDPWIWNSPNSILFQSDSIDALRIGSDSNVTIANNLTITSGTIYSGNLAITTNQIYNGAGAMYMSGTDDVYLRADGLGTGALLRLRRNSTVVETFIYGQTGDDAALYFGDAADIARGGFYFDTSANILQFRGYNNVEVFRINGSQILAVDGSAALPAYGFTSNPDSGMFIASDGIYLSYNNPTANQFRIDGDGVVFGEGATGSNTGAIGMTVNDGYGNANFVVNHYKGVPDQAGSSYRIECSADGATAVMTFELKNSVTAGAAVSLLEIMQLREDYAQLGSSTHDVGLNMHVSNSQGLKFYSSGSWIGEITCTDTTWLRINQNVDKNIYTPRMFRADGGFQVDGLTVIENNGDVILTDGKYLHVGTGGDMNIWFDGGNPVMQINTGILYVRNSTGTTKFLLHPNSNYFRLQDSSRIDFGSGNDFRMFHNGANMYTDMYTGDWYIRDNTTNRFLFNDNGEFSATGNITAYASISDINAKENIKRIENPLEKIDLMDGITFDYIGEPERGRQTGVIAQQVLKALPEAVYELKEKDQKFFKTKAKLGVNRDKLVGLLIEGIRALKKRVEDLEAEQGLQRGYN